MCKAFLTEHMYIFSVVDKRVEGKFYCVSNFKYIFIVDLLY